MSTTYVVGLSCTSVQEVTEPRKQILYSFEITWSDESITSKELSAEDLNQFRNHLKAEVYKSKPDVVIPEVPDGKVGAFVQKAKKAEKRKKNVDEFCTQIINLPHIQGKLQAIAGQFQTSPTDVDKIARKAKDGSDARSSNRLSAENCYTQPGKGNGQQVAPETRPETEVKPESEYAEVLLDRTICMKPTQNSKIQYVEIEIISKEKEKRAARETTPPVYAEVVMLKSSTNSDWLKPSLDPDEPGEEEEEEEEEERLPPAVPPRISVVLQDEDFSHSPRETETSKKTELHPPEQALEMTDSAESTLVHQPSAKRSVGPPATTTAQPGIFDAAMMSNFPSQTLIPLPPSHKPKKCPSSSDVTLSKRELPSSDVPNVCVVAISDCKKAGDNTLPFKRGHRAHLLYTTHDWWFISTGQAIGWVPADYWRIVTPNCKTVSGKPMAAFAPWNFGVIGRVECEALLKNGDELDFIVRESANSTGHLVLSVKQDETVHHFGVQITETGFCFIGQHHFHTIHNVVLYYMKHALFADANGIGCRLGRLFVRPKK